MKTITQSAKLRLITAIAGIGLIATVAGCPGPANPLTSAPGQGPALTLEAVLLTSQTAQGTKKGEVNLKWNPVTNAATYNVFKKTGDEGFRRLGTPMQETILNDPDINDGSKYQYSVEAKNDKDQLLVKAQTGDLVPIKTDDLKPTKVKELPDKTFDSDSLIEWDAVEGADLYYLEVKQVAAPQEVIYAAFTTDTKINLGSASPIKPSSVLQLQPVNKGGGKFGFQYAFSVKTIKTDAGNDLAKAKSIGTRDSQSVLMNPR